MSIRRKGGGGNSGRQKASQLGSNRGQCSLERGRKKCWEEFHRKAKLKESRAGISRSIRSREGK